MRHVHQTTWGLIGSLTIAIAPFCAPASMGKEHASVATAAGRAEVLDLDQDGLEIQLERELGTDPALPDTDGDGLSDYDEHCKYRTDPTMKDSDSDGTPDGDWQERREYTYTIRAICEIRPPSSLEMINDLYQDARPVDKRAALADARVVEVLIFPYATPHVYAQPYPGESVDPALKASTQATVSMNFSAGMRERIGTLVQGCATDLDAIGKMLRWIAAETQLVRYNPHWEYLFVIDHGIRWHRSLGSPEDDERFLETNFFGDSMFKKRVHGTCSSLAILRGTMLRAAGLPTRLIQTLPLMTRYTGDPEPLADRLRNRFMAKGYDWGPGSGGANHTYNEVFLNNRWIRVDASIGTGPFVGGKLFVKAWHANGWNNLKEEWNDRRCFRALDVSDAYATCESKLPLVDIAIDNEDLTVKKQPDGRFLARINLHNNGHLPLPRFRVDFYAGDADGGGRRLARHTAGPIMPGATWGEYNPRLELKPGEHSISVVVDPDNAVRETDETNNKAVQRIASPVRTDAAPRANTAL